MKAAGYIERVGRPFIIAAIILALFSLLSFLLAPEPDLYGVEAVRVFGYNFLVFLIIPMILSRLEDVKCR